MFSNFVCFSLLRFLLVYSDLHQVVKGRHKTCPISFKKKDVCKDTSTEIQVLLEAKIILTKQYVKA